VVENSTTDTLQGRTAASRSSLECDDNDR